MLCGPRTDAAVQSLTDPPTDLLHVRLPCLARAWALGRSAPGVSRGPSAPSSHGGWAHPARHVWFTGLQEVFRPGNHGPLIHRLIHLVCRKKASKRTRQSAAGDSYAVSGYRDDNWDPDNLGASMPFVPLAAPLFLLGDVFNGHRQQDDPASVPLLTLHTGGGIDPSPPWVVHGMPAFREACEAVCGRDEWANVVVLLAGPVPDADEWVVHVPHDPHVAITSLRDGGAVEQGSVVVYQPSCSTAVWGAKYTTALDAIKSVCGAMWPGGRMQCIG